MWGRCSQFEETRHVCAHTYSNTQTALGAENRESVVKVHHPIRQFSENVTSDLGLEGGILTGDLWPTHHSVSSEEQGKWPPWNRRTRGWRAGKNASELHRYKYTLGPCDLAINRHTVLRWCHPMLGCIYSFVHYSLVFYVVHIQGYMCHPCTQSPWIREDKLSCHFCSSSSALEGWFFGNYQMSSSWESLSCSLIASPLALYSVKWSLAPFLPQETL